jgi:hypothetical protein
MMVYSSRSVLVAVVLITAFGHGTAAAAEPDPVRQAVRFPQGATSAQLRGTAQRDVDYTVEARAGQTLAVRLHSPHASLTFNINPPGSANVSMFIGSVQGQEATLRLPADGRYTVRVVLMRSAARRHEHAAYTLDVALTGQALAPLPAAQDARVGATPFHATAEVPCEIPGAGAVTACQAGVVRRGRDGTATVEFRGAGGLLRRVLFVKGEPVAADSSQPFSASRSGEVSTVRFGSEERFDVPDALLAGG